MTSRDRGLAKPARDSRLSGTLPAGGAIAPAASGLKDMQDATDHPAIVYARLARLAAWKMGLNRCQASSDNHNKCVIAASLSVRPKEAAIRRKDSMCCMSSQPRP